jgi:hypothetical protein
MPIKPYFLLPALGAVLAGCASAQMLPDQPGVVDAIEDYYRAHAWEDGARCTLPEMQVTRAEVVGRNGDEQTIEVRYFWVDESRQGDRLANTCTGFASRTFTVSGGRVTGMSGEQRS